MKSPWDKDPKTVVIKRDESTEQYNAEEHGQVRKDAKKGGTKTVKAPPKTVPRGTAQVTRTPPAQENRKELHQAIDDAVGSLGRMDVNEPSRSFQAQDITVPQGASLGEILMSLTKLTREQLQEAVELRKQPGSGAEQLGEILVRKKFITEDDLLHALSVQTNIPIADKLDTDEIDPELVAKIPINFAKKHGVVPIKKQRQSVLVAIANAADLSSIDDLRILLQCNVKPLLAKKTAIMDAINRAYDRATRSHDDLMEDLAEEGFDMDLQETQDLLDAEDEAPIIRLVNTLLFRAVKERASDIHVEPFEKDISVRFRIDGVLYEIMRPPKKAQASISSRIKIMAQLDIAERRIPQDGRIKIRIAGRDVDIRVSTLPTSHGERIVLRLLDTSSVILNLTEIGFTKAQLDIVHGIIHKSHGIFLVTGPTGSGKTTTLYSCLSRINSRERNIITVEDPVEIQLGGIGQIQVNPKVNLTFAEGLRSILRQDPDVIMVGEIRDLETAEIAIQASLTGHLVFSTVHTNDAAATVTRLVDMGVEPFLVSSSLIAVMAQRLVRTVCKECREVYSPSPTELAELAIKPELAAQATIYRHRGCASCYNTGYLGRTGIYEILPVDDQLRTLISKSSDGNTIRRAAVKRGMHTLREDGALKVLRGITTMEEVLRVTQEDMEFS